MKTKLFFALTLGASLFILSSCGGDANGPAEKVFSKKVYSQVINLYDGVRDFHEGLCIVYIGSWSDRKYGAIDKSGKVIVPIQYEMLDDFSGGLAAFTIKKDDKKLIGFLDKKANEIIPATYVEVGNFVDGLAPVAIQDPNSKWSVDKLWGFLNNKGEIIVPLSYEHACNFSDGLARVRKGGKYGFINSKGEVVIPINYGTAYPFSEGLAVVEKGEKEMIIDTKGEIVYTLPQNMTFISRAAYHDGLIPVNKLVGKSWWDDDAVKGGYLNTKGEPAIDFIYSDVENFENGVAEVEKGKKEFYINTKGEEVVIPDEE